MYPLAIRWEGGPALGVLVAVVVLGLLALEFLPRHSRQPGRTAWQDWLGIPVFAVGLLVAYWLIKQAQKMLAVVVGGVVAATVLAQRAQRRRTV